MPIKFSKELYEKITQEAASLGMPRTQFINMLVNNWIEDMKPIQKKGD